MKREISDDEFFFTVNIKTGESWTGFPKKPEFTGKEVMTVLNWLLKYVAVVAVWIDVPVVELLGAVTNAYTTEKEKIEKEIKKAKNAAKKNKGRVSKKKS